MLTKSGKELHLSYLKCLKENLSGYGINPFILGYPINLTRREKIDKNVYNNMCQVEILRERKIESVYPGTLN